MNKMWIKYAVKPLILVLATAFCCRAQYYYKDIIVTGQINDNYRLLKASKVATIKVVPYEKGIPADETVNIEQTFYAAQNMVVTYTHVPDAPESWLSSYYNNNNLLVATTDSSASVVTHSTYQYNTAGLLTAISSRAVSKDNPAEIEVHQWTYNANGKPVNMIKIKDNRDTTFVSFEPDEQGNTGEEKAIRNKGNLGTTYYYYDNKNRLTDVARYNKRANRVLPDYIFEYNDAGQVTQMVIVPEGSSDYQTWRYTYSEQGLKQQDVCFNKQKQLLGKIEYRYVFGR
jgi:hypothetical protein